MSDVIAFLSLINARVKLVHAWTSLVRALLKLTIAFLRLNHALLKLARASLKLTSARSPLMGALKHASANFFYEESRGTSRSCPRCQRNRPRPWQKGPFSFPPL